MTYRQPRWMEISSIVGLVLMVAGVEAYHWQPFAIYLALLGMGMTCPLVSVHTGYMVERWLRKKR